MGEKIYRLQPFSSDDMDFLYRVYAGSREREMALTGWSQDEIEQFLYMQFSWQHTQYQENYKDASFDIICIGSMPVGRLYVERRKDEIRIIDITLLPSFQRKGIGAMIFRDLTDEADEKGLPLRLHVEHGNPVLPFYERLGFTIIGDTGVYYYMERPARTAKPSSV